MKVLVVSGFLGAGKTTFIRKLISRSTERLAVLENEFGRTDVDGQIISADSGADVIDLREGCVCCTKSSELHASVITIENTVSPDLLIVEPSGVGALGNVLRILKKIEYERISVLPPVTVVDAESFYQNMNLFHDVCADQLRYSSTVVISRPEHPDPELFAGIRDEILKINPEAKVLDRHYSECSDEWWNCLINPHDGTVMSGDGECEGLQLDSITVRNCSVPSPGALLWILESVLRGEFGFVVRAKGIIPAGRDWIRFDVVNGRVSVEGCGGEKGLTAECVFIGRNIDRQKISDCLRSQYLVESPFDFLSGMNAAGRSVRF